MSIVPLYTLLLLIAGQDKIARKLRARLMERKRRLVYIPIQVQAAQHGAERSTSCGSSRDRIIGMKKVVLAALSILVICSIGRADPLESQAQTEVARLQP